MFKLIRLSQRLNLIQLIKLRNSTATRVILITHQNLMFEDQRFYCSSKNKKGQMEEIEDFLKTTKINFFKSFEINQTETEDDSSKTELILFVSCFLFALIMAISFLYLYNLEAVQKVDYEKFAYDPKNPNRSDDFEKHYQKELIISNNNPFIKGI